MKELTLILVLVFTLCTAPACKKIKGADGEIGASPAAAAAAADPKGGVVQASRKLIAAKSLTGKVVGVGKLGITKDVQFAAPDRYHIIFDDETGARTEMISVGGETWIKSGDSWDVLPGDDSPTSTFRNNFSDEVIDGISDVQFKGEDMIDNKPMLVFTYNLVTKVGNFHVSHTIWVDQASGLPVKSIAEYRDGNMETLTTTFDAQTPVSIEPPIK